MKQNKNLLTKCSELDSSPPPPGYKIYGSSMVAITQVSVKVPKAIQSANFLKVFLSAVLRQRLNYNKSGYDIQSYLTANFLLCL